MLLLRSASRACLRAFLLTCAVTLGSFTAVKADTVDLTFRGVTQWNGSTGVTNGVNNGGGRFNFDIVAGSITTGGGAPNQGLGTSLFGGFSKTWTFCIEIGQYVGNGVTITYNVVDKSLLNTLPIPGSGGASGGMGATKASALQALASLMETAGFYSTYNAPAVQAAVWNIVHATSTAIYTAYSPYNSTNGDMNATAVQNLLNDISARRTLLDSNATLAANQSLFFYGLSRNDYWGQDQIVLGTKDGGGFNGNTVPVPAGVVIAGMGVVCLGGFNILRRRKVAAI